MRAVDTNVLVRLVTGDDERQTRAAERFVAGGAWVPLVALAEAGWVLKAVYGRSSRQIATAVAMLLEHPDLTFQDADVVAAAVDRLRRQAALGLADCLILESCVRAGHVPLGTFDRTLGKQSGAHRL
jgi:predicted nucleic-acid-binding protein